MTNDLNIPSTITAADLLAAGMTQVEVDSVSDILASNDSAAAADTASASTTPAPEVNPTDAHYDPNEMPGNDGSAAEIDIVDAENDLGEGDGIIIREYDPVRDAEPPATEKTEVAGAPAADAADTSIPDVETPLLDLRRPDIPENPRDFAAEDAAEMQKLAALQQQFDDGDITQDDLNASRATIIDSIASIRAAQQVAANDTNPAMDAYRDGWFSLVDQHMAANPILRDDPEVMQGFDQILRQVSSDPALRQLPAIQQIEIAHRRLGEAFLVARNEEMPAMKSLRAAKTPPVAQPEQQEPAAKKPEPAGPRTDPRPAPPVTLAGVSGAQPAPLTGDPMVAEVKALINSGDALAGERALARLSPSQRMALLRQ